MFWANTYSKGDGLAKIWKKTTSHSIRSSRKCLNELIRACEWITSFMFKSLPWLQPLSRWKHCLFINVWTFDSNSRQINVYSLNIMWYKKKAIASVEKRSVNEKIQSPCLLKAVVLDCRKFRFRNREKSKHHVVQTPVHLSPSNVLNCSLWGRKKDSR